MGNVFLIGDTHFGHKGMTIFTDYDGSKVRPWTDVHEMDEAMVENWNKTVKLGDKVYHLGDVAIARKSISIMARCNGRKVLIKGNHDIFELKDYSPFFKDIRAVHKIDNFVLSHIPIHPDSLQNRWCEGNIHGHMHNHQVMDRNGEVDPRYFNVSVERINYTPIALEEVMKIMRKAQKEYKNDQKDKNY